MICPKCQFQNPEGASVCQKCKTILIVPQPGIIAPDTILNAATSRPEQQNLEVDKPLVASEQKNLFAINPFVIRFFKFFGKMSLVLFGIFFLIIILVLVISFIRGTKQGLVSNSLLPMLSGLPALDSDNDGATDEIERKMGTNPNYWECSEYLQNPCNLLTASSGGEVSQNVLIILDSSGSMAEKINGKTKMDIAKSVLSDYLNDLFKKGYKVGLMVYGHKGSNSTKDKAVSCAGIETVLSIGSGTDQINGALTRFSPTGWTPIADSLLQTMRVFSEYLDQVEITSPLVLTEKGESVHATPQMANTVLLISDGEETCGGNPVDAAKKLKESGINAVVNVIGFGVDTKTRSQLQSIASAGGGKFLFSSDEESLRKAAEDIQTGIKNARSGLDAQVCVAQEKHKLLVCLNDFYYTKAGKYMKNLASQKTLSEKYKEIEAKFDEIVAPFIQSSRTQLQEGVQQIQQ